MRVLIACEESQTVCKAFRKLGHEAFSCDIQECSGGHPEWHIQDDVRKWLGKNKYNDGQGWDIIIAHPVCTRLTNSGVRWLDERNLWGELDEAANFFRLFLEADADYIAVENPIPHKYAVERIGRSYDQCVQPYMFGHPERKATCFWLKNLPKLQPTNNVKAQMEALPKSQSHRIHYLSPGADRAKERSKTFQGIAEAMADQWGKIELQTKEPKED